MSEFDFLINYGVWELFYYKIICLLLVEFIGIIVFVFVGCMVV